MSLIEENKLLLRELTKIIVEGDLEDLADHPGYYETRQRLPALRSAFPDLLVTIEGQIAEGEMVYPRLVRRDSHRRRMAGNPGHRQQGQVSECVFGPGGRRQGGAAQRRIRLAVVDDGIGSPAAPGLHNHDRSVEF